MSVEQAHLQDPIMWQLFMMIKLYLYLEGHQNPGPLTIYTRLTLKQYVNMLFITKLTQSVIQNVIRNNPDCM